MLLDVKNMFVDYGKRETLHDVSFQVDSGEVLAIIGHNGAGKTTALKAVMGFVKAKSGQVLLNGIDIINKTPLMTTGLGIRLLPAEVRGVFPTLSVEDNLHVAASKELRKNPNKYKDKLDSLVDLFPILKEKMKDVAGSLSGGQQQMLALSIALMGEPSLLMLDEPSIGLQPNLVSDILAQVRKMAHEQNVGVILVEQNANAAFSICDRVISFKSGKIIFNGTSKDISKDDLWKLF